MERGAETADFSIWLEVDNILVTRREFNKWNIVMVKYCHVVILRVFHNEASIYIYFEMLCCYIADTLTYIFRNTKISYFTSLCCFSPTLPPPLPVSPCKPSTQNSGGTITSSVHLFSILSKYFGASYYLDFDLMTHF